MRGREFGTADDDTVESGVCSWETLGLAVVLVD